MRMLPIYRHTHDSIYFCIVSIKIVLKNCKLIKNSTLNIYSHESPIKDKLFYKQCLIRKKKFSSNFPLYRLPLIRIILWRVSRVKHRQQDVSCWPAQSPYARVQGSN
jgi:hypothetical protein